MGGFFFFSKMGIFASPKDLDCMIMCNCGWFNGLGQWTRSNVFFVHPSRFPTWIYLRAFEWKSRKNVSKRRGIHQRLSIAQKKKMKLKGAHFKIFISSHILHPKSSFSSLTWPKWEELLKRNICLGNVQSLKTSFL